MNLTGFPSTEMFFGYCVGCTDEILAPHSFLDDHADAATVQAIAIGAMGSFWLMEEFGMDGAVAYGVALADRIVEGTDEG